MDKECCYHHYHHSWEGMDSVDTIWAWILDSIVWMDETESWVQRSFPQIESEEFFKPNRQYSNIRLDRDALSADKRVDFFKAKRQIVGRSFYFNTYQGEGRIEEWGITWSKHLCTLWHCDIVYIVYIKCTTLYNYSFPLDWSIISEKLTWTELQVTLHGITWLPIDGIG